MDDDQLLDVFDNTGQRGQIPAQHMDTAFQERGFKYAVQDETGAWKPEQPVRVTDNLGRAGWMPATHVQQAVKERGFSVGQPLPKTAGDKMVNGKFTPGSPQPSKIGEGGIDPFLFEGAQKVGEAAHSTGRVLRIGGKTMLKMAANPTPSGMAEALEQEREEQQAGPEGVPRSKDVVLAPLRELGGARQPGESATLGFTGHAAEQQPLLTRTANAMSSVMGGDPASARTHFDRASTLDASGNREEASHENQRGTSDLLSVPLATVGTGRLMGARSVQRGIRTMARDVVNSAPETLDRAAKIGDMWPPRRIEPETISGARNWLAKKTVAPLVRRPVGKTLEDARFGRSPEQAITDEGLMGTRKQLVGKTSSRIGELSDATDAQLQNHANAGAQIDAEPIIDSAIDQAIQAAKKTGNQAIETRLESLRQALKTEYGPVRGTPFEINNLKRTVGEVGADLGAFKGTDPVEASAASAMGDVYSGLKNAVNERVPEVAPLNDRIANLISALMALKRSVALGQGQTLLSGLSLTNLPFKIADATLSSGPVRTGVARILNAGNTLDMPKLPRTASKGAPVNSPMSLAQPRAAMPRPQVLPFDQEAPRPSLETAPPEETTLPRPQELQQTRAEEPVQPIKEPISAGMPALPRVADLDPTSPGAARISELRNELVHASDPAERARIQEGIDYELHRAGGIRWDRPDQATQENLPAPEPRAAAAKPEVKTTAVSRINPREVGIVDKNELLTDPERFQYKGGANKEGLTNVLGPEAYDPNKAGVLAIWEDPANRKSYVVNGHNRHSRAMRSTYPAEAVMKIQADTAEKARAIGAEINIAEGHGTGVDAARHFKEYGILTPEAAEARDLPLGQSKVQDLLALARLDDSILDKIESGEIPESRGVAIGAITENAAQQEAVLQAIAKLESRGKSVTVGQVESLARQVRATGTHIEEGQDLFGSFAREQSLFGEQSEIDDYILRQLRNDKRTFGAVASKKRAQTLGKVKGQQIVPEENQAISEQAARAEEMYNKLVNRAGRLNELRANAAKKLSNGYASPREVKAQAYESIRQELEKEMPSDGR